MSLLSNQLTIKKYVRELGLGIRDFNKLNRKYNTINLINQLKRLNPVASGGTGWHGSIFMELLSYRTTGILTSYNYTIYKGSTTASGVLVSASISNSVENSTVSSVAHILSIGDRLAIPGSTILVVVSTIVGGDFGFHSTVNASITFPSSLNYRITPTTIPTDVRVKFKIEPS